MTDDECRYLMRSEAHDGRGNPTGRTVRLCDWTDWNPERLMNAPRWLQRNALAGHLLRDGDCEGCPARKTDHD